VVGWEGQGNFIVQSGVMVKAVVTILSRCLGNGVCMTHGCCFVSIRYAVVHEDPWLITVAVRCRGFVRGG
jgi:hypothetical protein